MVVATLVFPLQGAYFVIGTLLVAEVFRFSAAQITALGGGSGIDLPAPTMMALGEEILA